MTPTAPARWMKIERASARRKKPPGGPIVLPWLGPFLAGAAGWGVSLTVSVLLRNSLRTPT